MINIISYKLIRLRREPKGSAFHQNEENHLERFTLAAWLSARTDARLLLDPDHKMNFIDLRCPKWS